MSKVAARGRRPTQIRALAGRSFATRLNDLERVDREVCTGLKYEQNSINIIEVSSPRGLIKRKLIKGKLRHEWLGCSY